MPRRRVVLPGDLEEGKCFFASLSGKTSREVWLGKVLLPEMVFAFEHDSISLIGIASLMKNM